MLKRILHLDMDSFFVSVERALDPSLKGKPVAVGGDPRYRGVVACASYEARKFGLKAGMPLATAKRLCPHAVFIPGQYQRYRDYSARFMEILAEYTPDLEPMGLDEAFIDLTGFDLLYGPPSGVAEEIRDRVRSEMRITVSVGIASCKVAAKVASDAAKPDGLLEVPADGDRAFLAPLPVQQLPGAGGKAGETLKAMGVRTIGDLAAASPVLLRRTLGAWGDLLRMWANGIDNRTVQPRAEAKSISRETTFPSDVSDVDVLRATLAYLGERVGASLRREGKLACCVQIKVRNHNFETITRQLTFERPGDSDDAIVEAGLDLLARSIRERREPIRLLGIGVANLVPPERQLGLFGSPAPREEHLSRALDTVREKYGFASLQRGRTLAMGRLFARGKSGYLLKTPALSR